MLITSTVEICIQHLGRVEEMGFAARRSYASAVLEVVRQDKISTDLRARLVSLRQLSYLLELLTTLCCYYIQCLYF